jgi:hypothetical protein
MKISAIDTREKFEAAKALGLLSDKEVTQVEGRLAKMVNKPSVEGVKPVSTLWGQVTAKFGEFAGQVFDLGVVTKVMTKGSNSWVSTGINTGFGKGKYLYSTPAEVKYTLIPHLIAHIEAYEAANGVIAKPQG